MNISLFFTGKVCSVCFSKVVYSYPSWSFSNRWRLSTYLSKVLKIHRTTLSVEWSEGSLPFSFYLKLCQYQDKSDKCKQLKTENFFNLRLILVLPFIYLTQVMGPLIQFLLILLECYNISVKFNHSSSLDVFEIYNWLF